MRPGGNAADRRSATRRVRDTLAAAPESDRANGGRTARPGGAGAARPWHRHARGNADSRHQAVPVKRSAGTVAARVAGGSRGAQRRAAVAAYRDGPCQTLPPKVVM